MNKVAKIGVFSLLVVLFVCILLPINKKKDSVLATNVSTEELAQELYDFKNPYIGDAPADGDLLHALQVEEELGPFSIELETEVQPYILRLVFTDTINMENTFNEKMKDYASVLLTLIENADEIDWVYSNKGGVTQTQTWVVSDAEQSLKIEDLKSYSSTKEKVEELLKLLD